MFVLYVNAKSLSFMLFILMLYIIFCMLFKIHLLQCFYGQMDERMGLSSWGFVDPSLMELAG